MLALTQQPALRLERTFGRSQQSLQVDSHAWLSPFDFNFACGGRQQVSLLPSHLLVSTLDLVRTFSLDPYLTS